jgi:Redoxin.
MPCLQEHPQMMALAQRHRIRMVGMNYKDRPEDARRWLAHNGNPFDEIMVDAQGRTAIDFGVYGVPETFLIDGEGRIRRKIVGAISIETLQNELLPAIEKLEVEAK